MSEYMPIDPYRRRCFRKGMFPAELICKIKKVVLDKKYFDSISQAELFIKQMNNKIMIDAHRESREVPEIRWQVTSEV